jgi:hypothetical protein
MPPSNRLEQRAAALLVTRIDHRMGHALFIGAYLPEVAVHLAKSGLTLTVVESDRVRLDPFLAVLKDAGLDKTVSVDPRPYAGIEFLTSSYNVIIAWDGIPQGMAPLLFFKKARRELKAGGGVWVRLSVVPRLSGQVPAYDKLKARVPARAKPALDRAEQKTGSLLSLPTAHDLDTLKQLAATQLNLEETLPLSILTERLDRVPGLSGLAARAAKVLTPLEGRLLSSRAFVPLASSVLLKFAKTREFGHVFRV